MWALIIKISNMYCNIDHETCNISLQEDLKLYHKVQYLSVLLMGIIITGKLYSQMVTNCCHLKNCDFKEFVIRNDPKLKSQLSRIVITGSIAAPCRCKKKPPPSQSADAEFYINLPAVETCVKMCATLWHQNLKQHFLSNMAERGHL